MLTSLCGVFEKLDLERLHLRKLPNYLRMGTDAYSSSFVYISMLGGARISA